MSYKYCKILVCALYVYWQQIIAAGMKDIYMSFKNFSSAQDASSKSSPGDKSKPAQAAVQPATQPDKTPDEAAPTPKS